MANKECHYLFYTYTTALICSQATHILIPYYMSYYIIYSESDCAVSFACSSQGLDLSVCC